MVAVRIDPRFLQKSTPLLTDMNVYRKEKDHVGLLSNLLHCSKISRNYSSKHVFPWDKENKKRN